MATTSGTADISDFADIVQESWEGGGIYRAIVRETGEVAGYHRYILPIGQPDVIKITSVKTHPDWRGRKVATAIGERIHLDHPDHFLELLGSRDSAPVREFWDYQKAHQPDWDTTVVNDGARERT